MFSTTNYCWSEENKCNNNNMAALLDQKEIANILAQELFYQQFVTLEGVPTQTTQTPTILRNVDDTFIELSDGTSERQTHENEAGFVPPVIDNRRVNSLNSPYIPLSEVDIYSKSSLSPWHSSISPHSQDSNSRPTPPVTPKNNGMNNIGGTITGLETMSSNTTNCSTTGRRNMGGRKPVKDLNLTPEEEERRRVRRERNKQAAARCRKRRVDHTNTLLAETEALEQIKQGLQNEIQEYRAQKEELEFLLQSHRTSQFCRQNNRSSSPPDVKPYDLPPPTPAVEERVIESVVPSTIYGTNHNHNNNNNNSNNNNNNNGTDYFTAPSPAKRIMLSSTSAAVPITKPNRPSSLNVITTMPKSTNVSELAGIDISTPSTGIQLNFDSMMVGGTGLTPVSTPLVQCSTQQRNNGSSSGVVINDCLITPDSCPGSGTLKLVSL